MASSPTLMPALSSAPHDGAAGGDFAALSAIAITPQHYVFSLAQKSMDWHERQAFSNREIPSVPRAEGEAHD